MDVQEILHNFIINNKSEKFTLADVEKSLNTKAKIPKRILEDHLEESPYLFTSSPKDETEKYYIPRNKFFHKAEFKVAPTAFELKKGILFSGHRFIPFYSQELFPTESFQIMTQAGNVIKTKNIKIKLEDLYNYYSLLGAEGIIENITADHTTNYKLIGTPSQKVNITVFDLDNFYKQHSFAAGMSLKFIVEDWHSGKFFVSTDNGIDTDDEKHKWFETLEEGLFRVFDKFGPYMEIPEQLALGFYYSVPSILKSSPCPIDSFIKTNEKIQVKFFENNTILWYPEEQENSAESEPVEDLVSISQGTIESLDAILEELGFLTSSIEIEAFIRDTLLTGNNDITSVMQKIFPESGIIFKDKAQETAFYNHLEELWEDITSNYDPNIDSKNASSRREILETLEIIYKQYNDSKEQIEKKFSLLESEITALHKNLQIIRKILDTLNNYHSELDTDDAEQLDDIVFSNLKRINELMDKIDSQVE
jgi:RNAse (barnase) inhibitor barstar